MAIDLGIAGLTFFLICNIVGAGVFFLQRTILLNTQSVSHSLFCWIFAGLISILLGICYSELGSAYPEEGGDVIYFNEAYGTFACLSFSIVSVYVILPLGCALMARLICTTTTNSDSFGMYAIMLALLVFLTLCNYFGRTLIVKAQQFLTVLKIMIVSIFVVLSACVFLGIIKAKCGDKCAMSETPTQKGTSYGMIVAMFSTLWSFDGWNAGNFVAHRIINPSRTLPISITISIIIVSLLYLAINISFFSVLSFDDITNSPVPLVYNYFHSLDINDYAKKYLTGFVSIIPSLGTLNGSYIVVISILDGLLAKKNNKEIFKVGGLILFTALTFFAGLMRNVEGIITKISFCVYVFYGMSIVSIFILRKKRKNTNRIFKAPNIIVFAGTGICLAVVGFSFYKQMGI